MKRIYDDFLVFGKVISSALLICGYIVLGLLIAKKLIINGYPDWIIFVLPLAGALIGIWQTWLWLKSLWSK